MLKLLRPMPLSIPVLLSLTLGLAPFHPQPHVLEKLGMLFAGELSRAIDWFDLVLHGAPWALLLLKIAQLARDRFTAQA